MSEDIYERLRARGIWLAPPEDGQRYDVYFRQLSDAILQLIDQVDRDYPRTTRPYPDKE